MYKDSAPVLLPVFRNNHWRSALLWNHSSSSSKFTGPLLDSDMSASFSEDSTATHNAIQLRIQRC